MPFSQPTSSIIIFLKMLLKKRALFPPSSTCAVSTINVTLLRRGTSWPRSAACIFNERRWHQTGFDKNARQWDMSRFNDVFVPISVELLKSGKKTTKRRRGISHISKCSSQSAIRYNGILRLWCPSQANFDSLINKIKKSAKIACQRCCIRLYSTDKKLIQTIIETTRSVNLVTLVSAFNSRLRRTS